MIRCGLAVLGHRAAAVFEPLDQQPVGELVQWPDPASDGEPPVAEVHIVQSHGADRADAGGVHGGQRDDEAPGRVDGDFDGPGDLLRCQWLDQLAHPVTDADTAGRVTEDGAVLVRPGEQRPQRDEGVLALLAALRGEDVDDVVAGDLAQVVVAVRPFQQDRLGHVRVLPDGFDGAGPGSWPTGVQGPQPRARLDDTRVTSVADLRAQLAHARADWAALHTLMAGGLLAAERLTVTPVQRMGRFTLSRFLPALNPDTENHLGETITDEAGQLAYLKTFRLSAAQTRRGHLLSQLAAHDWELDTTATALGTDRQGLTLRLDRAGFGHLLRPDIIDACRNRARKLRSPRATKTKHANNGRRVRSGQTVEDLLGVELRVDASSPTPHSRDYAP